MCFFKRTVAFLVPRLGPAFEAASMAPDMIWSNFPILSKIIITYQIVTEVVEHCAN
jgi:hypothetical protein